MNGVICLSILTPDYDKWSNCSTVADTISDRRAHIRVMMTITTTDWFLVSLDKNMKW